MIGGTRLMDDLLNLEPKKTPPVEEEDEYRSPEELGPDRGCDEHGVPNDPNHPWRRDS